MAKRIITTIIGSFLLMLISISLTVSTLHSHHNLELHIAPDFADTGQCFTDYSPLCPICGYLSEETEIDIVKTEAHFYFNYVETNLSDKPSSYGLVMLVLGRSPPAFA